MLSFATEFPIKPLEHKASFVAQVVTWLKGTEYSNVFNNPDDVDLDSDIVNIRSHTGENLSIRELNGPSGLVAVGFRHDYPDDQGRLWRTEAVVRRGISTDFDVVRLRTLCTARSAEAKLDTPRKPYLIKSILQDKWGIEDNLISTSDKPFLLSDNMSGLNIAESITLGTATRFLPIIYISALSHNKWLLSTGQIEKLAFDLGGVAHVVVEPSRAFSFQLRDIVSGKNCYGGALGFCLPQRGVTHRVFDTGGQIKDLIRDIRASAVDIRSQMPAEGWDWSELQEQAFRRQRERDRNRLTFDEKEALYEDEIQSLKEKISQLESEAKERLSLKIDSIGDNSPFVAAMSKIKEIYSGELFDRVRYCALRAIDNAERLNLDHRSIAILKALLEVSQPSPALEELREDIKRACKDSKRFSSEMVNLLERHGYKQKGDNKHVRLEPRDNYVGLDNITLAKTPSDGRGMQNARKQIERTIGISQL